MDNSFYCRICNISFNKTCNCTSTKCPNCSSYNIISKEGLNRLQHNSTIKCFQCEYLLSAGKVNGVQLMYCNYKKQTNIIDILDCPINKW